jgi:hypothetical protein
VKSIAGTELVLTLTRFAPVKDSAGNSSFGIALGAQIGERFEKKFQAIRIDRCLYEPRYGSSLVRG